MAVLPGIESVGEPSENQRRIGIGSWSPRIISEAGHEAGAGFQRLGADLASIGAEQQDRQNHLQMAQFEGANAAALTKAHLDLQNTNDPDAIARIQADATSALHQNLNTFSSPFVRDMAAARSQEPLARLGLAAGERLRTVNNENAIAGLQENIQSTLSGAVNLPDDVAGEHLKGLNIAIDGLYNSNAITAEQRVAWKQRIPEEFAKAKANTLYGEALTTGDYSKLAQFAGVHPEAWAGAQPPWGQQPSQGQPPGSQQKGPKDVYANIPVTDDRGENQIAKFVRWNPDPIGTSDARLAQVHPDMQAIVKKAQADNPDLHFIVGSGLRSREDQENAYKWGWSTVDPAKTKDVNQRGIAVDLWGLDDKGKPQFVPEQQAKIATAMKKAANELGTPITWGGDWRTFKDRPHFQLDEPGDWKPSATPLAPGPTPASYAAPSKLPSGASPSAPTGDVGATVSTPQGMAAYMARTAQIESGGNPNAVSSAGARTKYQFIRSTWETSGGGDMNDPATVERNMNNLTMANHSTLVNGLGREPTQAEMYLAHQQGANGFLRLMNEPGRRAGDVVGNAAIRGNGGDPNASAGSFIALWTAKYNRTPIPKGIPGFAMPPGQVPRAPFGFEPTQGMSDLTPISYQAPIIGLPPSYTPQEALPQAQGEPIGEDEEGNPIFPVGGGGGGAAPPIQPSPYTGLPPLPKDSILNALPADSAAEMRLGVVRDIMQMQRRQAMASRRDNREALKSIDGVVTDMTKGVVPNPSAWSSFKTPFMRSGDPQVMSEIAQADQVYNNISQLKGMSPAQASTTIAGWQAQLAQQKAGAPGAPVNSMLTAIVDAGQKYLGNLDQAVKKDILPRALSDGVISELTPLDPNDPNFGTAMGKRVQEADAAASHYGMAVPQYIRPAERIELRRVAGEGGQPMVNVAEGIVSGAGPKAADVFRQIGADAPAFLTIGSLALDPNVDHSSEINRYTTWIAATHDKDAKKRLTYVNDQTLKANTLTDPTGTALAHMGVDYQARMREAGFALASDSATMKGIKPEDMSEVDQDFVNKAFNQAAGATYDENQNQYGGFGQASQGARHWYSRAEPYQALVPTDMRADKFADVIGRLTDADLAKLTARPHDPGAGDLSAAAIQNGQFVAVPNARTGVFDGKYQVLLPDPKGNGEMTPVVDAKGRPWSIDISALAKDPEFRGRIPDAFKPIPSALPRPSYLPAHGVMEPEPEGTQASLSEPDQG